MNLPDIPASTWRKLHATLTGLWALLALPTILWWHDSVLFIGLVSCYANAVGHFSAYQASRAEDNAEPHTAPNGR